MLFDFTEAEIMVVVLRIDLNLSAKHFIRKSSTVAYTTKEIKVVPRYKHIA